MLAIRLRRAGSKKRPFFRVVVADSRAARDSSFVEILGHYNPRTRPAIGEVDKERVDYWLGKGAQPSDSVRTLMARHLTPKPAPAEAAAANPEPCGARQRHQGLRGAEPQGTRRSAT